MPLPREAVLTDVLCAQGSVELRQVRNSGLDHNVVAWSLPLIAVYVNRKMPAMKSQGVVVGGVSV